MQSSMIDFDILVDMGTGTQVLGYVYMGYPGNTCLVWVPPKIYLKGTGREVMKNTRYLGGSGLTLVIP